MLNKKGQGLTEYGIILLLILLIGMGVWFNSGIRNNITSIYYTISHHIGEIAGIEQNYDLSDEVSQKGDAKKYSRRTPAYATSLYYTDSEGNRYNILYRYEGSRKQVNGKWEDFTNKVYTLEASDGKYHGTEGLMTSMYAADQANTSYANTGYTKGTDSSGNTYSATYFNSDGQTYVIRDYGNKNTVLTNYTGDVNATVTNAYNNTPTTVAALAAARTNLINGTLYK